MSMNTIWVRDWHDYEGKIVPRHYAPLFVILSYFVSLIGSWTTLELIGMRTSLRGWYNWFIMIGASITLGGMAVWCTHFLGGMALVFGHGEIELQVIYSPGFTALSAFLPILVVLYAFVVTGPSDHTRYDRLLLGGFLAGLSICAMHYLGQAGIQNYNCWYDVPYVIASVLTAITASILALGGFSLLHSQWSVSWWKRGICAIVLSLAASGMHWFASFGTRYQLKVGAYKSSTSIASRNGTTVLILILSIIGCFYLFLITLTNGARRKRAQHRSRQVVLTTAIFNREGRLLVTGDGLLPNRKITNDFLEQGINDTLNIYHPLFLWMFRTTRHWESIIDLVPSMRTHLQMSGFQDRFGSESNYINDQGTPIENYALVFRELFCSAASDLANDFNEPLQNLGILYDEIIPTDQKAKPNRFKAYERQPSIVDLENNDIELEAVGKGQLLFLVRNVDKRGADHLEAAGYRFAEQEKAIPKQAEIFRIRSSDLKRYLEIMGTYTKINQILEPGVHVALFAVRASVSAGGFEILARKDARNLLPTMQMPIEYLETWQVEYIQTLDAMQASICLKSLSKAGRAKKGDARQREFAKQLQTTIEALKNEIGDASFFSDSNMIAKPLQVPCRGPTNRSRPRTATLICFRLVASLGSRSPGKKLDYTPLALFKTQQLVYKNSRDHAVFARQTYRDFADMLDLSEPPSKESSVTITPRTPVTEQQHRHPDFIVHNITERLFHTSDNRNSYFGGRHGKRCEKRLDVPLGKVHSGGIMVSRGVSVTIDRAEDITDKAVSAGVRMTSRRGSKDHTYTEIDDVPGVKIAQVTKAEKEGAEDEEMPYVDELFDITIKLR